MAFQHPAPKDKNVNFQLKRRRISKMKKTTALILVSVLTGLVSPAAAQDVRDCSDRLQRPIVTTNSDGDRVFDRVNTAVSFCDNSAADTLASTFTQDSTGPASEVTEVSEPTESPASADSH